MKVLLDESAPRIIQRRLSDAAIRTVQEMGWAGIKNGDLLERAEREFDIFVTADKNLRHQQNLSRRRLAIIVLPSNQIPIVLNLLTEIEQAISRAVPGTYVEIVLPNDV
ncbi:MAG: DUF5615 family PIN-like protein [Nitrospirota bacterium]